MSASGEQAAPGPPPAVSSRRRVPLASLIAVGGIVLVGALASIAVLLFQAQQESRESAERRFAERAEVSAALTQSVFSALGGVSGDELMQRYGGTPSQITRNLAGQLAESQSQVHYLAVVDARGKSLAAVGKPPPTLALSAAPRKGPTLSNVLRQGRRRSIEYAIPFGKGARRRAIVQGVPLKLMANFLHSYLERLRGVDGAGLAVLDSHGVTINRQGEINTRKATPADRLATRAVVPGTSWNLQIEADRAKVLAGVNRRAWLPWLLLGALAIASVGGAALYLRMLVSVRRQREAVRSQRESNRALHESRDQARNLVEALEEAVVLFHADGRTELLNASARDLMDTEASTVEGLDPGWEVLDDDGAPLPYEEQPVRVAMATGLPRTRVVGLKRPDGSRRWMTVRARPLVRPGESHVHAVVASSTDVTEQREMELHLTELAQRDPLTGLWNRRRFEEDVARQLSRCRRYDERAALLVLDLDGFKQVNDTLGHLAGDEVLRALADGLSSRLRASDGAARTGGDEFAVLLVNVTEQEARAMASDVAARLTGFAREHLGSDIELSLSAGVAVLDQDSGSVEDVLAAADRAMYADKRRPGRPAGIPRRNGLPPAKAAEPGSGSTGREAPLRALLAAVQARDSYTAMHSRQVVTWARAVARRLGLDEHQASDVESVALLHDLGKIAVPDAILRKRGPLTEIEALLMRQHPVVGAQMVTSIPELEHLAPAIRAEHERWDGHGYPDGLAGEAIPLASRIAFVCDAYHAMTSDRPYRKALSHEAAMAEIASEAGHQFCPASAAALLEVLEAEDVVEIHADPADDTRETAERR